MTPGFSIEGGILRCSDVPGEDKLLPIDPDGPRSSSISWLAENVPVLFRVVYEGQDEMPPRPPQIRFISYTGQSPFLEVDAPELGGVSPVQMSTMNHQWIFMDPYSAQLATLDAERKTWFIRKLPLGDTHGQTVLLNWPDTVVPVSYTHLDVYKRQSESSRGWRTSW